MLPAAWPANSKSSTAASSCLRASSTSMGSPYTTLCRADPGRMARRPARRGITRAVEVIRNFLDRRAGMGTMSTGTPTFSRCSPTLGCGSADRTKLKPRSRRAAWPTPRQPARTFARRSCTWLRARACLARDARDAFPGRRGGSRRRARRRPPPIVAHLRASSRLRSRPAPGRPGRSAECPRPTGADLRLVHRRLQNRRSEGCEGAPSRPRLRTAALAKLLPPNGHWVLERRGRERD